MWYPTSPNVTKLLFWYTAVEHECEATRHQLIPGRHKRCPRDPHHPEQSSRGNPRPHTLLDGAPLTGADVVPVLVVGAHLLVGSGLDQVAPRGELDTAGVLQVLGVRLDEVSRGDIAHGDSSRLVVRHGVPVVSKEKTTPKNHM